MSLIDEIKRLKEEIAEKEKEDQKEENLLEQPPLIESEEENKKEEVLEEEKAKEKEEKKEEELDNAGYARLRREATAAKRAAEEAKRELEEFKKAKESEVSELEEQQKVELPDEVQSVIQEHRMSQAEREFSIYENKVKQQHPEYGAIASEYAAAMYQSIRLQNPRKSEIELNEMTKRAILTKAGEFARAGYENPVEEMYHEAKELGFTGKSFQKEEIKPESKEEKIEPDLRKVAENRKRSTGMTANNGRSEGMMTVAAATDLTAAEWARLPNSEKRRLMYGQ